MRKLGLALFALLAITAVVAGCGGGSDSTSSGGGATSTSGGGETSGSDTSSGGAAPTKAAFIKEADKICGDADEELNEEIGEYAKEHNIAIEKEEPTTDEQVELYEEVVLPNVAKQGEDIAALTPPEGDEETIEELTDSLASGVEEAEADPQGLTEGKNPLGDASKKASAYGLKTCGAE